MPERPTEQLQRAVLDADTHEAFVSAVHSLYRNLDHAEALPIELLYLHLGMAIGRIQRMLDEREEAAPEDRVPQ
jgi:hypothetical protein